MQSHPFPSRWLPSVIGPTLLAYAITAQAVIGVRVGDSCIFMALDGFTRAE